MNALNTLIEISIYAAAIVIVTMLLKTAFKHRMSPWLHYAVWLVLIMRLMLPVTMESGFHVFTTPAQTQSEAAISPQARPAEAMSETTAVKSNAYPSQPTGDFEPIESVASPASSTAPVTNKPLSTENVLLIIWLSGAGISLIYIAALYAALRFKVRRQTAAPSARLLALFDDVMTEMLIKAKLTLVCQYAYSTPALLLPRTVLMPIDTLVSMNDEQIKFALRHELTHYRHRDHITCLLICVLNAVYWFNPFVWLAFRQMRADMELACDGSVVKALDIPQKSRYAALIVGLFAQPERRQLVPGMAQGDAKRIAEQRVRGIFKAAKSHRSAKLVSALVAALLLVTCFTTACQPTPEKAVVVNKGDNHLEEMIASSAASAVPSPSPSAEATQSEEEKEALKQALRESIGAPMIYTDSFSNEKGDVTVSIDAEVVVPAVTALPVAAVTMSGFTQERVNQLAEYFLSDAPVFTEENVKTKDEIMADIIYDRQRINQLSQETESNKQDMISMLEDDITDLEEEYKTAPEDKKRTPSSIDLLPDDDGSSLYVFAELGKAEAAHFIVGNNPRISDFSFNNDGAGLYYPAMHRAEELNGIPRGMSMNREDAEQLVLKCIRDLKIDDMQIASVLTQNYLNSFIDVNDEEYMKTANQCYEFTLTKAVKGLPILLIDSSVPLSSDDSNAPTHREPEYTCIASPEHIYVYVDDTGIVRFEWYEPTALNSILSDNMTLQPFDDILQRAKENIFYKNYTAYGSTADICITQIELNLMRIMRKDKPGEYLIVPVWDFIGNVKQSYDGEEPKWSSFGDQSYVTINAIDGSWINRDWGY